MSSLILNGLEVRDRTFEKLARRVAETGRRPGLHVILVGDDPASAVYVRSKGKACDKVGYRHETHLLPAATSEQEVLALVARLNADDDVHGILVQIPLPAHISEERVQRAVLSEKDVDGFHPENLGRLLAGHPRFVACTPLGVQVMLEHYGVPVAGKRLAIVGRSVIVGRPLAMLMSLKGVLAPAAAEGVVDPEQQHRSQPLAAAEQGVGHRQPQAFRHAAFPAEREGQAPLDQGTVGVEALFQGRRAVEQRVHPCCRTMASQVLRRSMAMVMGPTPPGTGV
jgi:methylenetetrahydrofolate dehydrogenase (NADP+)/methenyltetrahydrofolate cyclohydrolase